LTKSVILNFRTAKVLKFGFMKERIKISAGKKSKKVAK